MFGCVIDNVVKSFCGFVDVCGFWGHPEEVFRLFSEGVPVCFAEVGEGAFWCFDVVDVVVWFDGDDDGEVV